MALMFTPPPPPEGPVDHEAIKTYFDGRDGSYWGDSEFGRELSAAHAPNPFSRFIFGRAQWTYIPMAISEEVEKVIQKHRPKEIKPSDRPLTHSYVHYKSKLGEKFWYIPPRSDHQNFLRWLEAEWPYATEEQREIARQLLVAMEHDGHGIKVSLLALAQGE
jgi:hypothetical protein